MSFQSVKQLGGWEADAMLRHYARSVWEEAALREAERFDLTRRLYGAQDGPGAPKKG